ncbi:MAG: Peptidase [Myxococcaceae bacterium]|nr:Peptidase [Myxococcaceae bacterium]
MHPAVRLALAALVALPACHSQTAALEAGLPDAGADVPAAVDVPAVVDAPPANCGTSGPAALAACVREADLARDLAAVASPRPPASAHHDEVRELCATRFAALGYAVERHDYGTGVNVVGVRAGSDATAPRVLVSAHYDHIDGCPGADDNGSGVAGVLEAARVLATGRYERTLVVACWDEEERGLVGSQAYARRARANGEAIAAAYVFEMIGYRATAPDTQRLPPGLNIVFPRQAAQIRENGNRGDFIALVGDESARASLTAMERAAAAVGLPTVTIALSASQTASPLYGDLQRSDHAPFWAAGYPAIQITDTAEFRNARYHCRGGPDTADTLDPAFMRQVVSATVGSAAETLRLVP